MIFEDLDKQMRVYEQSLDQVILPETYIFARLMDAGKLLKAKITKITRKGSFRQISVGIYLVDF